MNKKELRKKYKELRQFLSTEEIEDKSLAIANQLLRLDIWDKLYYHLFLTIEEQKEINTEYILQILAGKDKEIVISKCNFETLNMTHFLLTDNTKIKKNSYNVPEPIDGLELTASFFVTLPSLPVPIILEISKLFSAIIFLADGLAM